MPGWAVTAVESGRSTGLKDVGLASIWGPTGRRASGAMGAMVLAG